MFFKNLLDIILTYEVNFIKWIQVIFGGPENNLYLIKFGKLFTNNYIQTTIINYTIILKIMLNIIYNGVSLLFFWNNVKEYLKLIGLINLSKFINYRIKHFCQIRRPYVDHDNIENITIRKDKSKSYSFPSNSVQNTYVLYYCVLNSLFPFSIYINHIVYILVFLISLIKTLRGLHYLHDIVSAIFISNVIVYFYMNYIYLL